MSFQTKDFASISASLVNYMRAAQSGVTDFSIGSVVRTMLETHAIETDELYRQMVHGLLDAIPVSVFDTFDFPASVASSATATVTFVMSPDHGGTTIPAGTRVHSTINGLYYAASSEVFVPASMTSFDVLVSCEISGSKGNGTSQLINSLESPIEGVLRVFNQDAIYSGVDLESDESRRHRFRIYIQNLARATFSAVDYGARQVSITNDAGEVIERAEYILVHEPWQDDSSVPAGLLDIYIHNGTGSTSNELQAAVHREISGYYNEDGTRHLGWKAAGVVCRTHQAEDTTIHLRLQVFVSPFSVTDTIRTSLSDAVGNLIQRKDIGHDIYAAEIVDLAMDYHEVINCVIAWRVGDDGAWDASSSSNRSSIEVLIGQKALPGNIEIIFTVTIRGSFP